MLVCVIKYICHETNEYRWLDESLNYSLAKRICQQLERDGRKPVLYRVRINPELTIKSARSSTVKTSFAEAS